MYALLLTAFTFLITAKSILRLNDNPIQTGENRTQVDRLVFDDADDEPEENPVAEAWKQTAISSQSEKIQQLLAHRHQLKQQRTG